MKQVVSQTAADPSAPRASSPVFGILDAARSLEARLEATMAESGLSMAKFGILKTLALADRPLSLTELASCQQCVRSNITQLVDRLEGEGMVRRVDDPTDRRSIRAELTSVGRERFAAGEASFTALTQKLSVAVSLE